MGTSNPFPFRTFVRTVLILVGLGMLALYVIWQARFLLTGPVVQLTEVPDSQTNARIVNLSGKATNITRITLNGKQIYTDPQGQFTEALVLENGYTVATIAATDRYGRTTELRRPFIYTPASILSE